MTMSNYWMFALGLLVGCNVGLLLAALLAMARRSEE